MSIICSNNIFLSAETNFLTSVLYLQSSDSISLGFDKFRDAVLLFFDHGCELLHQRARFLLPLLGLGEGRLKPQQLCSYLIISLFDLEEQREALPDLKSLSVKVTFKV